MQYHHEPLHILNIFTYLMFNYKILKILLLIFTFHCFLFFFNVYLFIYWPRQTACGISVLQPGIKPMLHTLEAQSLNHWTAREVPHCFLFNVTLLFFVIFLFLFFQENEVQFTIQFIHEHSDLYFHFHVHLLSFFFLVEQSFFFNINLFILIGG